MSGQSYALETPCTQVVPAGTYKVSCSSGGQSRVFHVVADPGHTTCILWDGTRDGYAATTIVEGTDILLDYREEENLHDGHTVIVDPHDSQEPTEIVISGDGSSGMTYLSALLAIVATFFAGLILILRKGDKNDD